MAVKAILTDKPIARNVTTHSNDAGAIVHFYGCMRPTTKDGRSLDRLVLEWHPRLTQKSLDDIAQAGQERFDIKDVTVIHRCGAVEPNEIIVFVEVKSDHRREAFEAADYIMDRLKTEAVFWKREEGPWGSEWIEPTDRDYSDRKRWSS